MEQYEFIPLLQNQEYGFSLIPPDCTYLSQQYNQIFLLVNMHSASFDAFSFFDTIHDTTEATSLHIIAYTDIKHDHEGIHKAKTHGVKYVCTKEQVKDLLNHIQQSLSS